jgi:outer membrane biogenesis lipoprotein LolB
MTHRRSTIGATLATLSALLLTGCSLAQGPADRETAFMVEGRDCTAQWWLGEPAPGTPAEALTVAREALDEAEVSDADMEQWKGLISLSQDESEARATSDVDLAREAYVQAVREHVRDELAAAGYPDEDRVIEVYAESRCS